MAEGVIKSILCRYFNMDIYRLYQLVNMWEAAFNLTKPNNIQKVRVKPIIDNDIEGQGEGNVYGAIELYLETKDAYTQFNIIEVCKEYKNPDESKKAQEAMVLCLTDYLEQFLDTDEIELIWSQMGFMELDWEEKP